MVGVQDEADVEGPDHRLGGLFSAEHPEEVAGDRAVRVGGDDLLALAMPVECGDQGRGLRDESDRLADVGLRRVVIRLGVEEREARDQRLHGVHGRGVGGRRPDHVEHAGGEFVLRSELLLERGELGGVREVSVPEKVGRLLEGRVPGERIDVDADVFENPLLAVDEGHLRLGRDGVDETLVELLLGGGAHGTWTPLDV